VGGFPQTTFVYEEKTVNYLSPAALAADLAVRDLTDPASGPHALQLLVSAILDAASARWPGASLVVHRGSRVVSVADNYDHLGYASSAKARDSRYTRYVAEDRLLRSQTSALIPGALRASTVADALIACPGMVYRRDAIDRLHTGTPHQLDLWRTAPVSTWGPERGEGVLLELVGIALRAALPNVPWRTKPAAHPYTTGGREIEALGPDGCWVEVGECGIAAGHVLPAGVGGLALGLGLDRLLMLRKGIDDIRLLRSADRRVATQMTDLTPYRPVSAQPAARRDLSVALPAGVTAEDLGDRIRDLLGDDAHLVEEVAIRSATPPDALPAASRERLGLRDGEVNVLLRVVLRDLHAALPRQRANALRDRLWVGLMGDRGPVAVGLMGDRGPVARSA
jgi:phenylalanyl-tRNA synthetase alpha chain